MLRFICLIVVTEKGCFLCVETSLLLQNGPSAHENRIHLKIRAHTKYMYTQKLMWLVASTLILFLFFRIFLIYLCNVFKLKVNFKWISFSYLYYQSNVFRRGNIIAHNSFFHLYQNPTFSLIRV